MTAIHALSLRMWPQHLAAVLIVAALGLVGVYGRAVPLEVTWTDASTQVQPGDFFVVRRRVRWLRADCHSFTISADFIDSLGYAHASKPMPLDHSALSPNVSREWQVPYSMPWGPTLYQGRIDALCFPFYGIWPIKIDLPASRFNVVPPQTNAPAKP